MRTKRTFQVKVCKEKCDMDYFIENITKLVLKEAQKKMSNPSKVKTSNE